MMVRLAILIAAFVLLAAGTARADMAAGVLECSGTNSELTWQGASPQDLLLLGSKCGFSEHECPTTSTEFLELAEKRKCRGERDGPLVGFVCTGNDSQVKKAIEDLCKALFP
jgi:hypothetical protein